MTAVETNGHARDRKRDRVDTILGPVGLLTRWTLYLSRGERIRLANGMRKVADAIEDGQCVDDG
jgi:hypothetical protein